jgi:PAS domain S-box-containing protein
MLGYNVKDEVLGENMLSLVHHSYSDGSSFPFNKCPVYRSLRLGESCCVVDEVFWRCDGTSFPVEYIANPIIEVGKVIGAVIAFTNITERKKVDEALQETNERLKNWINELEQLNRQNVMINEMGDMLQACFTAEEAYTVIVKTAQQLFSAESGVLYILHSSGDLVETTAVWGKPLPYEGVFAPDECWALRRGHLYVVDDPSSELLCRHLSHPPSDGYLCMPLMAQGKSLGMLHLQNGSNGTKKQGGMWKEVKKSSRQQLAVTMAEHIAMALANLKLR